MTVIIEMTAGLRPEAMSSSTTWRATAWVGSVVSR
jgi:hypothetical protein